MAYLVLIRHGKSEWNAKGLWTGWQDVDLTPEGHEEARHCAECLHDIQFDVAHVSSLKRAQQTLSEIKKKLNCEDLNVCISKAIDERNYGVYTGKNKWEVKEEVGDEKFTRMRRDWDEPIPEGETLKDVYERVVPYYIEHVKPDLCAGKNVLVVAHGNSLRALRKYLEEIGEHEVASLEIGTGEAYVYEIDTNGKVCSVDVRAKNENRV